MNSHTHKKLVSGKLVSKTQITADHFQIGIACPYIAKNTLPGQFIQVRVNSSSHDPLLCRPFAVYRSKKDVINIMFKVVGKGTRILSEKAIGDMLDIIGPLGNGFPVNGDFKTAILVAGGMGIAALMRLAEKLHKSKYHIIALIGACSQDKIIGEKDLQEMGVDVQTATEDGSCGYEGMVTQLLESVILKKVDISVCQIFACGPVPMLKTVAELAKDHKIPAYVSLEERMACGVGACLGCAYEVVLHDGKIQYKMVCTDGPVFDAQEILWK